MKILEFTVKIRNKATPDPSTAAIVCTKKIVKNVLSMVFISLQKNNKTKLYCSNLTGEIFCSLTLSCLGALRKYFLIYILLQVNHCSSSVAYRLIDLFHLQLMRPLLVYLL